LTRAWRCCTFECITRKAPPPPTHLAVASSSTATEFDDTEQLAVAASGIV